MKRGWLAFALMSAVLVAMVPGVARAADCAFEDVNDNGVFDVGDVIVLDSQWLGGTAFSTPHPFVVPAGCSLPDLITLPAPLNGVQVTATKITFLSSLTYIPPGGRGVVFIANLPVGPNLGDGSITIGNGLTPNVKIEAGGHNTLPLTIPAVPQKSIALLAAGPCSINNAHLIGNRPVQDTRIGINCDGDVVFRQALVRGSRTNIQSINGKIDARSFAGGVGSNLAQACDDPALNLVGGGGAPGNGNGVLDPGDFPCQINLAALVISPVFADAGALAAFCLDPNVGGKNVFQALNDPIIFISKLDLDMHGVAGSETEVLGRYGVRLIAEDGNVNTAHTAINHGPAPVPGGSVTHVFANPAIANRLPVDHEDVFGPSTGTLDVTSACYTGPVRVGQGTTVVGVPDPPPCTQIGAFVSILNGNF